MIGTSKGKGFMGVVRAPRLPRRRGDATARCSTARPARSGRRRSRRASTRARAPRAASADARPRRRTSSSCASTRRRTSSTSRGAVPGARNSIVKIVRSSFAKKAVRHDDGQDPRLELEEGAGGRGRPARRRLRIPVPQAPRVGGREGVPRRAARRARTRRRSAPRSRARARSPSSRRGPAAPVRAAAARRSTATAARRTDRVPRSYAQGMSVGEKKNALKAVLSRRVRRGADRRAREAGAREPQDEGPEGGARHARHRGQGALRGRGADNENFTLASRNVRTGSSWIRSASTPTTCWPTATVVLSKSAFCARRQEPGRRMMLAAGTDPPAAHHREGDAAEGGVQHGLLRGRRDGQQDRGRRAVEKLFGVKVARRAASRTVRASGSAWAGSSASARPGRRPTSGSRRIRRSSSSRACNGGQEVQTDLRRQAGSRRCSTSRSCLRSVRRRA